MSNLLLISFFKKFKWLSSRVAVVYVILFVLIMLFVDLKTVEKRTKIRLLNGIRPDFTQMNAFHKNSGVRPAVNWAPYKKYFELVLRYMPHDPIASEMLGYIYFYTKEENKAIALLKDASEFSTGFFWPNYNLGVIYYKRGEYQQSVEYLSRAIRANVQETMEDMYRSVIYRQILSSYSANLNLKEELAHAFGSAYVLMQSSLGHLKQYDQMLSLSAVAIEMKELPYQDAYLFNAGIACLELKQIEKSLLLFERSLMLEKKNPEVYLYLSRIYQAIGKNEVAQELLKISKNVSLMGDQRFPYDQKMELRYF